MTSLKMKSTVLWGIYSCVLMKTKQETGHSFDVNNNCSVPVDPLALILMHRYRTNQNAKRC